MIPISRRNVLTAAAAGGGLLTAATIASAQSNEPVPQPQRPGHGGTDPGPRNVARDRQNPDILVPPSTDHGTLPNLRFSFSDSHMRLETGGWTRQGGTSLMTWAWVTFGFSHRGFHTPSRVSIQTVANSFWSLTMVTLTKKTHF